MCSESCELKEKKRRIMLEETENRSKISIWWDIENCHVPKDVDPHFIAQNMTAALHHASLTGPIEIQVFGDTMILPHNTQKALSDTGITLNHVPRGNKDAADKAILVAMLLWALDNPPPANILLISGDGDFANALHRLRLKTYSILLAVPAQIVKPALTGAAKKLWFWKDMAKGQLAEPEISQSNGNTSVQEAVESIRSMNSFQHRQVSSGFTTSVSHSPAGPKEYASPQKKISEQNGVNTADHLRSLSLDNPSSFSSHGMSRSHSMEHAHSVPSNINNSPGGASNISASNKLNGNASPSQRHLSSSSNSAARSMDFGQYPYFLPPQGDSLNSLDTITSSTLSNNKEGSRPVQFTSSITSSAVSNNKEESRPPQFTSMPAGLPNKNKEESRPPQFTSMPAGLPNKNKEESRPMPAGLPNKNKEESRPPQFTSMPAGLPSNNKEESWPPQFNSMPAGLPRGPLKHIAPNNTKGANNVPSVKNTAPEHHNAFSHRKKASEYGNTSKITPPSSRPTTSVPPSKVAMSNPEKMSHEACLDKIYSAMKTLERDMLAPTESNLADCIQYWDPQNERVDVKQTLNRASELQQVTRTQLGGGLVMFFPPDHRVPWNCVDPGNMQYNHSADIWFELQRFLLNGDKKQGFLSSCSRYDAALFLKNACSMHIQSLAVGKILNLLQQAMQEKKWFKKYGAGWAPLVLNQKVLLDWSGDEAQKGDLKPSTSQGNPASIWKPVQPANAEKTLDKDVILGKLGAFLSHILKDNTVFNLSFLPKEFEGATGMSLDYQRLGYASLQDLMKELTDIAYVETTDSGLSLIRLVKANGNVAGLVDNKMADKENDVKVLRQIQIVRELKSWLSYLMTSVKDGYDISRVHQDFLQASGKDLSKEGLDFSKLVKQFPDVIHIARSQGGLWLAYPASRAGNKSANSVAESTS